MEKSEITKNDVILCETSAEFNRMMELFELDTEYMDWSLYNENTVLYPLENAYGEVDGYCKKKGLNIINSKDL